MIMRLNLRDFSAIVAALFCSCALAAGAVADDIELTPLVVDVLSTPTPVKGSDSRYHLVYELRLANPTPMAISLTTLEIFNGADEVKLVALAALDRNGIASRLSVGGRRGAEAPYLTVGQFGILFLHVAVDEITLPKSITHRISGTLLQSNKEFAVIAGRTAVNSPTNLVLAPPLKGEGYFAGDGCCDSMRHVRALLPLNGDLALAQRFAIDWEQVGSDKRLVHGEKPDMQDVKSYNIYGKPVHAVADGTVVARRDDLPDQIPGKLPDNLRISEADGNFVVLKIGNNGPYALFAHLQKNSVANKGPVKAGDLLGYVGNSGNTSAPHLHFHVMDGPSPLLSNGLPYVIGNTTDHTYTETGIDRAGTADFDKAEATGSPLTLSAGKGKLGGVLPLDLTVVDFK
jgi:hypothetical protein